MTPKDPLVEKILATLTPREREVLKRRFGITMSSNPTPEELIVMYEITRARIKEFEKKARKRPPDDDDPKDAA
jgi:RNA polymerase primary sigma factor